MLINFTPWLEGGIIFSASFNPVLQCLQALVAASGPPAPTLPPVLTLEVTKIDYTPPECTPSTSRDQDIVGPSLVPTDINRDSALVPYIAPSYSDKAMHGATSGESGSKKSYDFMWESYLVNILLMCFPSTSVPTFLGRLREFSGAASDGEWMQKATLFMAMESGQ